MALFIIIHGEAGVGKTRLAATAPAPRLVLDVEQSAEFIPGPKIEWDPQRQDPRELSEDLVTVITHVRDYDTVARVYQWLNSGAHPFNSVIIDSLTELQKRAVDKIAGVNQMREPDWGVLLRYVETDVRQFRDLKTHPIKPVQAIVMTCATSDRQHGVVGPHLLGQLGITVKGFPDVVGYLNIRVHQESGWIVRYLQIQPINNIVAKDRTDIFTRRYGIEIPVVQTSP
ncbi:MAG: AAA family ATPase, partial [Vicinamibacterales bacterium]